MGGVALRLACWQHRRALWIVAASLVLTALLTPIVRGLPLRSDWIDLLPRNAPSVSDLHAGEARVGSLASLALVIEGADTPTLERFTDALVPALKTLPARKAVQRVEWNVRDYQDFLRTHRNLYAPLADLKRFRDDLSARIDWEINQANPMYVDLEDSPPPEEPDAILDRLQRRFDQSSSETHGKYPGGYYVNPAGRHIVVFVRANIPGGDADASQDLIASVRSRVDETRQQPGFASVQVELAGDIPVTVEEHDAIQRELIFATLLTIGLCIGAILVLFRRPRAIAQLGGALVLPVVATFAFARGSVGHLNSSTAFLGSIIIGNGINPGIVWLARYFEERRAGLDVPSAIASTHRGTWAGTAAASLAASLAYGSLVVTSFRGFRDFGVIGGVGMMVCWLFTMLILPAYAAAWDRGRPLESVEHTKRSVNPYGRLFARISAAAPVSIVVVAGVLTVAGAGLGAVAIAQDPREYDFRKLTSVRAATARASELTQVIEAILGHKDPGNTIALLVPRREDTAPYRAELERRRDTLHAPFGTVHTLDDLLPDHQLEKIALLADIRRSLKRIRSHVSDTTRQRIDDNLPVDPVVPISDADLPDSVAALYAERDGTRGRMMFVEERPGATTWDGRYLVEWSAALRAARLPDGGRALLVGRAPIFADMISAISRDGPLAVVVSFLATAALVVLAFRRWRRRITTLVTLLVGVSWVVGCLAVLRLRLNFLNFVALPITFGIGADYAVNVMRRVAEEGFRGGSDIVRRAVEETGGAVVVCSLTTISGTGRC